jgi:hypothetical protein
MPRAFELNLPGRALRASGALASPPLGFRVLKLDSSGASGSAQNTPVTTGVLGIAVLPGGRVAQNPSE